MTMRTDENRNQHKRSILDVAGVLCPLFKETLHKMHQKQWKECLSDVSTIYNTLNIQSMTGLPTSIFKIFYWSAMVTEIFGLHYDTLWGNSRSVPDSYLNLNYSSVVSIKMIIVQSS